MGSALTTDDAAPAVVAPTFAPGSIIADRYRIESRLGAGGGGTVWRCTDQKLDAVMALKIVSSDGDLERWRREVAMARRIADRNVCRVHDLGETADLRFVTMELVEGTSLRSKIRADLPVAEARSLFVQIVSGVAAIHAAGVVHRDLKPENIVVATDGRAVIVDFGLAREPRAVGAPRAGDPAARSEATTVVERGPTPTPATPGTVTEIGTVVGTPRYMAPEQAAGEVVDARADLWALALIGHELLTGVMPNPDPHGRAVDPVVDAKWPGGSAILRRCLALLPDERYADARELLAALAVKRRKRWPLLALGAAVVVAAGAGVYALQPSASAPVAPYRMLQITTTSGAQWPDAAPLSVAIAPDAQRFAYTTAGAKLFVRDLAGGAPVAWPVPKYTKPSTRLDRPPEPQDLVTITVAGWYADGSLGLIGTTREGEYHLIRAYQDGKSRPVHSQRTRLHAAIAADRVAIADDRGLWLLGAQLDKLAAYSPGEPVVAIAWSPDETRLACARVVGDDAVVEVVSGTEHVEVWRGPTVQLVDPLLAWLDAKRLAFAVHDTASHLLAIDVDARTAAIRETWEHDEIGAGTASNGTVLFLRGTTDDHVQIRDPLGWRNQRAHADAVHASHVAGWTPDGRLVFLEAGRIASTKAKASSPWPNTTAGVEIPDTLVGDRVIAHFADPADAGKLVVVRIAANGDRKQLLRIADHHLDRPIRCAGDSAAPCMVEQIEGDHASWTELDPETGVLGKRIAERALRDRRIPDAALSLDGALLAIVDGGNTVTLIDRQTGATVARPLATGEGSSLVSTSFGSDGDVWVVATWLRGRPFGLTDFGKLANGNYSSFASVSRTTKDDALRRFGRVALFGSDVDKNLAIGVAVRDVHLDVWRADGL